MNIYLESDLKFDHSNLKKTIITLYKIEVYFVYFLNVLKIRIYNLQLGTMGGKTHSIVWVLKTIVYFNSVRILCTLFLREGYSLIP